MILARASSIFITFAVASTLCVCTLGCKKNAAKIIPERKFDPPKYEGCFRDGRLRRDMSALLGYNDDMSKSMCEQMCRNFRYAYFGLQEGTACWCGESFGSKGQADDLLCEIRCSGQKDERCGGILHNSVYKISY